LGHSGAEQPLKYLQSIRVPPPQNKKGGFPVPANRPAAARAKALEKIAGSFQRLLNIFYSNL
jgi:hypothetical protein